jgi:very-short-patch-repair endonuclease
MSIDSLLARQAGIISRRQALAAGLSRDAVDHRVRVRRWVPLHPQVYLVVGHRRDDEVAVRGATLWGGDGAVLSGEAAAWWQGLVERPPPRIRLVVPRRRNPRARPGTEIRRRDLAGCDVVEHRGLLVTARPLTVLDTAVDLGPAGSRFLDRVLQRSERFPAVHAAYCRNLGAAGSASAGRLLAAAADRSASVAERLLVRMLRDAGARGWHCGFPASGHLIVIAFPESMLAIEVDGWAWHMDAARTQADKRRQHALVRAGWTILRYTWHDLVERPKVVLAEIAHAISRVRAAG